MHARLPQAAGPFSGSSGQCYRRIGKPLTITSAAVTYIQQPAANQQPANHGLGIKVPAADNAALRAVTTKAYHSRDQIAISDNEVTRCLSPLYRPQMHEQGNAPPAPGVRMAGDEIIVRR